MWQVFCMFCYLKYVSRMREEIVHQHHQHQPTAPIAPETYYISKQQPSVREYLMNMRLLSRLPACILNRNRFLSKFFGSFHLKNEWMDRWMDGRISFIFSLHVHTHFDMLKPKLNWTQKIKSCWVRLFIKCATSPSTFI